MSSYAFGLLDAHYDCFRVLFFFKSHSLSPNCWDTLLSSCPPNVGELTAITNYGRTRRRARSEKKTALGASIPTIFVWDCKSIQCIRKMKVLKWVLPSWQQCPCFFIKQTNKQWERKKNNTFAGHTSPPLAHGSPYAPLLRYNWPIMTHTCT